MITAFIGKSGSGKTQIVNELVKQGYKKIITYTTRPIRENERPEEDYHYITEEDFLKKINDGFFAEWEGFDTVEGRWYYGSAAEDYIEDVHEDKIVSLNPRALVKIQEKFPNIHSIYIYANRESISERLKNRKDKKAEVVRRMSMDDLDFKKATEIAKKIVYNSNHNSFVETVNRILVIMDQWKKGGDDV